jgi:SAM-dependent methyltransferase
VINLSVDKAAVFGEVARVLRPGGRFAVSDVIADPGLEKAARRRAEEWTGCVAGALTHDEYVELLTGAGLVGVEILETHRVHEHATSAIVRARKPAGRRQDPLAADIEQLVDPVGDRFGAHPAPTATGWPT